ncbi:MAG: RNA polymerase sigma factor, partial [Thermoanaerobaculia bacterium]
RSGKPMRRSVQGRGDPRRAELYLAKRMIAGDESAFEEFADDYIPPLYRFAQRRLADRELTRDIVQETVCKAIAKLPTFRGEAALTTWLCACCRNEIAAHFRSAGRRPGRTGREVELTEELGATESPLNPGTVPDGPEQALLRKERGELVHVALDALPPHYSKVLQWKYVDRLSVKEIAARLRVGPKAAESLLTRARNAFRDGYEGLATSAESAVAEMRTQR